VKIVERQGVGTRSLTCNTLGVEDCVRAPGWVLRKMDKQDNYSHGPAQTKQQVG